jgi:DNA polymerase III subunit delta'
MLAGHEDPWRVWRAARASDRLHHGWILTGKKGLGKGAFALAAAAELVAEPGVPQPAPEMHPDIIRFEHLPSSKEEEKKRDDGKEFQTKRTFTVDQVRWMQQRLTTRPTLGSRRAILIDPADDRERGAANALLKSLEEPPAGSVFLLVAHRLGRLPATIRSRCRVLRFAPLADIEIDAILTSGAPGSDAATRAAAIAAAEGSPGAALGFVADKLGPLHALMQQLVTRGDDDFALRGALSAEIGARSDRERIAAALDLARSVLARSLRDASSARQQRIIEAHAALTRLAAQAPTYNFDPGLLVMEIGGLVASAAD